MPEFRDIIAGHLETHADMPWLTLVSGERADAVHHQADRRADLRLLRLLPFSRGCRKRHGGDHPP